VSVQSSRQCLSQRLVLFSTDPIVNIETLSAELYLLAVELALLDRLQDIAERGSLLLLVLLAAVFGRVADQSLQCLEQAIVLEALEIGVRVALGQLEQQSYRLASSDAQIEIGRLQQVHQMTQMLLGGLGDVGEGHDGEKERPGGQGSAVEIVDFGQEGAE